MVPHTRPCSEKATVWMCSDVREIQTHREKASRGHADQDAEDSSQGKRRLRRGHPIDVWKIQDSQRTESVCPPKIYALKPHPHCDSIRR